MASVRMSVTDNVSGLQALHVIATACKGFLGPEKSVKLITSPEDDGCEMVFTTQRLLSLLDIEHPSGHLLRDACRSHFKQFGTGCTTLVCMCGAWARAIEILLTEGIPCDAILRHGDEILKQCVSACEEEAMDCTETFWALQNPGHSKQDILLEPKKYNHRMNISIPCEGKITKNEPHGISYTSILLPKTVEGSNGATFSNECSKEFDHDMQQTLVKDTCSITATENIEDIDDVSWYFDSNDRDLEHSKACSPSDPDEKSSIVDCDTLNRSGTSMTTTTCAENTILDSFENLTSHFVRGQEIQSSVDKSAGMRIDPNLKSSTIFGNIHPTPVWRSTHAKRELPTLKNNPPMVSYFHGNLSGSPSPKLNHHGKVYRTQYDDTHQPAEDEKAEECSQDSRILHEQNMNTSLTAGEIPRTNLPKEDRVGHLKATLRTSDSKTVITTKSPTSLQEPSKEIDAGLTKLEISKKNLPSRFPSMRQILLNSRHFQNGVIKSDMKERSEIAENFSNFEEDTSCLNGVSSGIHLGKSDFDNLGDIHEVGPIDTVSSALSFISPPSKVSGTSLESLRDSGVEVCHNQKRREQTLRQQSDKILTNQNEQLETYDFKIRKKIQTDDCLNSICNFEGSNPDGCLFQNSKLSSLHLKGVAHTKISSPQSFRKIFQKRSDIDVSSEMITSGLSHSTTQGSKEVADFKNLCDGLSHGSGISMTLARDVFLNNLQSGQFEDPYICRVLGPASNSSTIMEGLVLSCDIKLITLASSLRGKPLKAVLINGDLTKNYRHAGFKGSLEVKVVVDSVRDIPNSPQEVWLKKIMGIISKFEISVVLVKGHADASLIEQCLACSTLIIPEVPHSALQYLSSSMNTPMNSYLRDVTKEDICEGLYIDCWEAGWKATIRSLHTQRTAYVMLWGPCNIQTVMICAPSNPQLQSLEEKFLSGYHKLKDVWKSGLVCPGMGATEIKVMRRLEEYKANVIPVSESYDDSVKRKITEAFQAGFEEFIVWLVQNCQDITKFDIKSCIHHLVSSRTPDSKSIQNNLFPQSQETKLMGNARMESCAQADRSYMFNFNTKESNSNFNMCSDEFCTNDRNEDILIIDEVSEIDSEDIGETGRNGDTSDKKDMTNTGDIKDTGYTDRTGDTEDSKDTEDSEDTEDTGDTGSSEDNRDTGDIKDTEDSGTIGDTGDSGSCEDTGDTGSTGDTDDINSSEDSGSNADIRDTGETRGTGNSGSTGNSSSAENTDNTMDTGSTGDTDSTNHTGSARDTRDTEDAEDTSRDTGDKSVAKTVIFDCFSSKVEAWQSAWNLIKLVMNIDSVVTTGLSTNELGRCDDVIL